MLQQTGNETRNASQTISFPRVLYRQISREISSRLDYSPSVMQIGLGIGTNQIQSAYIEKRKEEN